MLVSQAMLKFFAKVPKDRIAVWELASLRIALGVEIGDKRTLTVIHRRKALIEAWELFGENAERSIRMISELEPLINAKEITLTSANVLWILQESDAIREEIGETLIQPLIDAIARMNSEQEQIEQEMRIGSEALLKMTAFEAKKCIYVTMKLVTHPPDTEALFKTFEFQIQFDHEGQNPTATRSVAQIWSPVDPPDIPFLTVHQQFELAAILRNRF